MSKNKAQKEKLLNNYKKHLPKVLFRVGSELFAGVCVGVWIGILIDNHFDTKPIFILVFFLLGCMAGILNVFRIIKQTRSFF